MSGAVCGRYAPSPSGRMHIGNALSALLAWCSARSQGGSFVLRLEDLDERCADAGHAQAVLDDLRWLGIDWDGEVVRQSERRGAYEKAYGELVGQGLVYPCFCSRADLHAASAPHLSDGTPLYAGTCRELDARQVEERTRELYVRAGHGPAMRLRVPQASYAFTDGVHGPYSQYLPDECGDFVVRRGDGVFAYQLVVVVDDAASGVTEVVRGSDLLPSTPRQLYLHELLGLEAPVYRHHPMLLAPDGRRLSKRERDCDLGYVRRRVDGPEDLVGMLAAWVGLVPREARLSARELAGEFDWARVRREDVVLASAAPF